MTTSGAGMLRGVLATDRFGNTEGQGVPRLRPVVSMYAAGSLDSGEVIRLDVVVIYIHARTDILFGSAVT